jgi:hypothetical protein
MALADVQSLVDSLVRDAQGAGGIGRLASGARDQAVGLAVRRYSLDRPRLVVSDVAVPLASNAVEPPADWDGGETTLEYPVGDVPPTLIDPDRWQVYATPTGRVFQLWEGLPAGAVVRVTYGMAHQLDAVIDTVPARDREALASYAAAVLLDELASAAASDGDATIQVDGLARSPDRSKALAARAENFRRRYHELLGIDPKRLKGASVLAAPTDRASWGGPRLLRGARR